MTNFIFFLPHRKRAATRKSRQKHRKTGRQQDPQEEIRTGKSSENQPNDKKGQFPTEKKLLINCWYGFFWPSFFSFHDGSRSEKKMEIEFLLDIFAEREVSIFFFTQEKKRKDKRSRTLFFLQILRPKIKNNS